MASRFALSLAGLAVALGGAAALFAPLVQSGPSIGSNGVATAATRHSYFDEGVSPGMLFLLVWFGALALGFLLLALSGISRPGPARAAAWAATVALTVSAGLTALTIGWLMVPAVVVAFAGIALASRRAARPADS